MPAVAVANRSRRCSVAGVSLFAGLGTGTACQHPTERILTMTTTDTKTVTGGQHLIEQRLDALDRALLGILPRSERLALVAQVETRVRELTDSNGAAESSSELAVEPEMIADAVPRGTTSVSSKRRSRLALSSGILGIIALFMLFAMPITYVVVSMVGEDLGEFVAISLLSIHVLVVAVGGLVALVMGIAGLISLSRRKGRLVGHGWAITGLCTAPLPAAMGGLMVLVTSFSLLAVQSVTVETSRNSPPVTVSTSSYNPAPPTPSHLPLPLSAAPNLCAPGDQCPQLCPAPVAELSTSSFQAPATLQSVPAPTLPGAPPAPAAPSNPPPPSLR